MTHPLRILPDESAYRCERCGAVVTTVQREGRWIVRYLYGGQWSVTPQRCRR